MTLKDYLRLSAEDYEDKHGDEALDDMEDRAPKFEFTESLVLPYWKQVLDNLIEEGVSEGDAKQKITTQLTKKNLSSKFVKEYMKALEGTMKEIDEDKLLEQIEAFVQNFDYQGKTLKLKDLESTLDITELDYRKGKLDSGILGALSHWEGLHPKFAPGIEGISDFVENRGKGGKHYYSAGDLLDTIDPKLTEDRKEFYDYWEQVYDEYEVLRTRIKDVLDIWHGKKGETLGGFMERLEEGGAPAEENPVYEELDEEMDRLSKIYEKLTESTNYVAKVPNLSFELHSRNVDRISATVNIMLDEALDIWPKKGKSRSMEEDDDEPYGAQDIPDYGGDEDSVDPRVNEAGDATMETDDKTQEEIEQDELRSGIRQYKSLEEVDPLSAIAFFENKFKHGAFIRETYERLFEEARNQYDEMQILDPSMANMLEEFFEDLKEIDKEIIETKESEYHLPLVTKVIQVLNMDKDVKDPGIDYEKMSDLHFSLIEVVSDIIETPTGKSVTPMIMEYADTMMGKDWEQERLSPAKLQDMAAKQSTPQMRIFRGGDKGIPRDLKDYSMAMTALLESINNYYIKPAHSHFLPFLTIPTYLDSQKLSQLKMTGPDSLYQLLEFGWYSHFVTLVDMHDLRIINDFLKQMTKQQIDVTNIFTAAEKLLDVLGDTFHKRFHENDKRLLAKVLATTAKRNNLDIKNKRIGGDSVEELAGEYNKREHPSSYFLLIKLMNHYKSMFEKDKMKADETAEFFKLTEKQRGPLLLAEQRKIMTAHDEIRKMMKKPTYFAFGDIDDYDTVNETIDLIKSQYNHEITASDIRGIVHEFDSMNSISSKYGINEEVVYHVKALYR